MPELPDLVHVERVLRQRLLGKRVTAGRVGDPTVLRVMVPQSFAEIVGGRTLRAIDRRGHFLRFAFDGELVVVVNAMLVGRYKLLSGEETAQEKEPPGLGFSLTFEDGGTLRYIDDKRMGKVYVARSGDEGTIPIYGQLGIDLLSPAFDRARFLALCRGRRDQVRMFLMDKRALASIGNAYADEILFAARLHPKTMMRQLDDGDRDRLFTAIGQVLHSAIAEIERRDEPIEIKVRDFLLVRGRDGKPCRVCGTTIRAVRVGDGDACFCPSCQPATRSLFVDWRKLPPATAPGEEEGGVSGVNVREVPPAAPESAPTKAARPAAGGTVSPRPRSRRSTNRRPGSSES